MKIYTQASEPVLTEQHFQFDPSFGPYIITLRDKMEEATDITARFYRYLIKKFQQEPELLVPFKNVEILEEHDDLIQLLRMSLLPLSADSDNYCMALAFMQPSCLFYYTESFKKTFIDHHIEFDTKKDEVSNLRYFVKLVLHRCYGVDTNENRIMIKHVYDPENHSIRHFKVNIESRFIHVHANGELPPFNDDWYKILNAEDEEFLDLFKGFPSSKFRLEGFCMIVTEDVSSEVAINQLKNAILHMHTTDIEQTLEKTEVAVGELLGDSRIKIGITPFFKINGKVVYEKCFTTKCVCISAEEWKLEKGLTVQEIYEKFLSDPHPYVFSNVEDELVRNKPYLNGLASQNVHSYLVYPINTRDGLMGALELGSEQTGFINSKTIEILQPAIPIITDLIYHMIETFEFKIDRLVKEKFTPLQQSVEWKFNEVAWEYLLNEGDKKQDELIGNVVFREVHPLYGSIDIRDSSVKRNIAVKNDFIVQLRATLDLLEDAINKVSLPLLESLRFKCNKLLASINDLLTSEDELQIREFIDEVVVFFKHLPLRHPQFIKEVELYLQKTDMETGEFHQYHRAYELSFKKINKSLLTFFEDEMEKLQAVYPFYSEKYRTDGIEYNIYIGQSIVPEQPFDQIYLKNLRLWQLSSMAQVALSNYHMLQNLLVPLQTTQLILVHSYPIDISFRKDERRFDVEGSYNIRYEMLKKRIDKVKIKGTTERLTQPDKIAIVYSSASEVEEYMHHISFLQDKGFLNDDLELLELENLQGVTGLKALRVGVKY